jgi:hypothetical protein
MSVHLPFPIARPRWDTEYALSMCGVAGMYALAGAVCPVATPLAAAVYGIASALSTRAILCVFNKCHSPTELTQKVASFVVAFLAGSLISAFLTNASGLSMSFAAGMLLNAVIISSVLTVTFVAIPCILFFGAAVGLRFLPS